MRETVLRPVALISSFLIAWGAPGAGCAEKNSDPGSFFLRVVLLAGKTPVGAVRVDVSRGDGAGLADTYCFKTAAEGEVLAAGEVAVSFALRRAAGEDPSRPIQIKVTPYESLAGSRGLVSCPPDFSVLTPVFPERVVEVEFCGDGGGPRELLFHLTAPECSCEGSPDSGGEVTPGGSGSSSASPGGCCGVGQACGAGISSDPSSSCKADQCCLAVIRDMCAQPVIE